MALSARTAHAIKWSLLGEAATRLIAPLVLLVMARLLLPADFGVVAAAAVLVSFSQTLADAGLGRALVQRADRVEEAATTAFWMNLALAGAVMLALQALAPLIAMFFRDDRITDVVRLLSLQVPLAALCTVQVALLQRDLAFKELFVVRLLAAGLPALASIPMALSGYSYWALVAGTLVGQLLQLVTLWWRSPWRPAFAFDARLARELIGFGGLATLSAMLAWFYLWMDVVVVGRYFGAQDMGLYRTANTFVSMLFGLAFAPLLPVLYSLLSRSGHDLGQVRQGLLRFAEATIFLALPMAAVIALTSTWIEMTVFGPAWKGLGLLMALLAAGQGMAWLVGANGEAYRAIGRPGLEAAAMAISSLAYLAGYLVSIPFGLVAFVTTRALLTLLGIAIQIQFSRRALGIHVQDWLAIILRPAVFSLVGYLLASQLPLDAFPDLAQTVARTAALALIYAGLVATLDRARFGRIRSLLHVA